MPRQAAKIWLASKGHLKNVVELHKEQAATEVMQASHGLFADKLPCNVLATQEEAYVLLYLVEKKKKTLSVGGEGEF